VAPWQSSRGQRIVPFKNMKPKTKAWFSKLIAEFLANLAGLLDAAETQLIERIKNSREARELFAAVENDEIAKRLLLLNNSENNF